MRDLLVKWVWFSCWLSASAIYENLDCRKQMLIVRTSGINSLLYRFGVRTLVLTKLLAPAGTCYCQKRSVSRQCCGMWGSEANRMTIFLPWSFNTKLNWLFLAVFRFSPLSVELICWDFVPWYPSCSIQPLHCIEL